MLRKVIFVVCDGLGDRPIKEFKFKTPLEAAKKTNLNKLASEGITGLVDTVGFGIRPGSDVSHMALFGYDPFIYYPGRGPFEAAGIGMKLEAGDIALRGNFGTVNENWLIKDRRAGRIENVKELCELLDGIEIEGIKFFVKAGTAHRAAVVMRGKGLSDQITDADPHVEGARVDEIVAKANDSEANFTAKVLNEFMKKAYGILNGNEINRKRIAQGKLPANFLLLRGAGKMPKLEKFEEKYGLKAACIAGAGLYKGIASMVGMEILRVEGATGMPNTNVEAKFKAAVAALKNYDFIFVHVKPTDSFGEDGNFKGKKEFIEKVDKAAKHIVGLKETLIVVTADHSTSSALKAHTADPVPILMCGEGVRKDNVKEFGERACMNGGLHRMKGINIMPEIINLMGKAKLYGA